MGDGRAQGLLFESSQGGVGHPGALGPLPDLLCMDRCPHGLPHRCCTNPLTSSTENPNRDWPCQCHGRNTLQSLKANLRGHSHHNGTAGIQMEVTDLAVLVQQS